MMKGKPTAKIQRRAAGLQIKAALEPRPDSGNDLASDIFRAVKANEKIEAKSTANPSGKINLTVENPINQVAETVSEFVQNTDTASSDSNILLAENPETKSDIVSGNALVKFGGGQMRVVSLQPPKPRKVNKQPKKLLQIKIGSNVLEKIPALFERTKAEELYDLLYQLTLGADEPCQSVRVRRSDLMASTNIKTRLTLDLNLKRLEENGLLKLESRPGEQEGNIYTVYPLPASDRH